MGSERGGEDDSGGNAVSHWAPDYCETQFQKHWALIAAAKGSNEASTRLRAIDTVLFDVLGWDKLDVEPEKYCRDVGEADYLCHVDSAPALLIEAKREGEAFVLPDVEIPEGVSHFGLLAKECRAAEKAIRQVISYAPTLGVRYVAISNGYQWIITLSWVAGQRVEERQVIVFESLEAVEKKFRLFWQCFSPKGIAGNQVLDLLLDVRKAPPPAKLSQRLAVYPESTTRNKIADELAIVLGAVWEEVKQDEDEIDFLRECYVIPEASNSALALAKELIEKKASSDERVQAKPVQPNEVANLIKEYSQEKPIVVLGDVGNGKTTFLKYLRKLEAAKTLEKYIQLDIDFIDTPAHAHEVEGFIYSRIEEQLQKPPHKLDIMDDSLIRAALNADLNRFKKSPDGKLHSHGSAEYRAAELAFINNIRANKHEFFKRVFIHLRASRNYSLAVFIDNLDRRLEPIQEEAYLRASAIARDWSSLVFICLRPTTFHKSRKLGVLDSVAPKVIPITSAKSALVLARRTKFAKRHAEGAALPKRASGAPFGSTFSFSLPNVATVLNCLTESFRHRKQLVTLFEATGNGNTREMLRYVYQFFTSKFLDTQEIVDLYRADPTYRVPVHHALRALLFGDFIHYDPKVCPFINLFDIQQADRLEHFTRLTALNYLSTIADTHPTYGYARVNDVVTHLCKVGYSTSHATWTLRYLFEKGCVEPRAPVEKWSEEVKEVRTSHLGRYHLTELIGHFAYFDAITIDTPILDPATSAKVWDARARPC